ncbi:hypothetical protein F8S13_25695 [Chloroflexia bacterium SDU3-3]|nr:hypothetical protein F8S13_25695 [Chloroflexia bacterium SDU3-3]
MSVHSPLRDAFVVLPHHQERARLLNTAVLECAIVPIVGASGSGKTRFLHWWWQAACADQRMVGPTTVQPEEIIFIRAQSLGTSGIPILSVVLTQLFVALQELNCLLTEQRIPHRSGKPRSLYSKRQIASLLHEEIAPLFAEVQPQAIVITSAEVLDDETLTALLHLRRVVRRGYTYKPTCGLVLCARVEPEKIEDSRFSALLNRSPETRTAWPDHLTIDLMSVRECGLVLMKIIQEHLQATFAPDVDPRQTLITFGRWTDLNWWLVEQLVQKLDYVLGPIRGEQKRIITHEVVDKVQSLWKR